MVINRNGQQRKKRTRDLIDRRVDNWLETGRKFVDGVSGTRPGRRRSLNDRYNDLSFSKVGRWVGDKIDWLLEDEDEWLEPWETERNLDTSTDNLMNVGNKQPLEAISRRAYKALAPRAENSSPAVAFEDEWPEDSSFRVERWQREQVGNRRVLEEESNLGRQSRNPGRRFLPKSSRKRY